MPWTDEAFKSLRADKRLGKYVQEIGPPRLYVAADPFRALVMTVVSQQLSGKAAESIFNRLDHQVGVSPNAICVACEQDLRAAGLSTSKSRTLITLAQAVSDGFSFSRLKRLPDEQLYRELIAFKGLGPWSVEMYMMFCLGRPDVHSPGDLGLRKGLKIVYKLRELPEKEDCDRLYKRWIPWRTAASWYLWRIVEGTDNGAW